MDISQFQARRKQIFNQMPDNSIAILAAAPLQYRNSDAEHPFRQDSHFYYVTGFDETFAITVLLKQENKNRFILFCQDRDPQAEQWTGVRAGVQGAREIYGADEAYSISQAALRLPEFFVGINSVYYLINNNPAFDKKLFNWISALRKKVRSGTQVPYKFIDLRTLLDEARLIKSNDEIKLMQRACDISSQAHIKAMQECKVGMYEYELEAILLHEFYRQGSRHPAYTSIVGAGKNACTLHYVHNNAQIVDHDLVLIDAGAEFDSYAADITRTFPANGKFTKPQQAIYELVLASQLAAIDAIEPNVTWDVMQETILKVLVTGLIDLKILKGDVNTLIEEKAYQPFYMHNSGHWLGMDVHDVGDYKIQGLWRKLMPGMVFTVEPGLYISHDNLRVNEQWRGIGVRIEDDILVTGNGSHVLTQAVPKTVSDIEKLMSQRRN
jgi:Xaa-Pro aminopeptidase